MKEGTKLWVWEQRAIGRKDTRCQEHSLRIMKVILGCLYFMPWKIKNYLMFFKQGEWHAQYVFWNKAGTYVLSTIFFDILAEIRIFRLWACGRMLRKEICREMWVGEKSVSRPVLLSCSPTVQQVCKGCTESVSHVPGLRNASYATEFSHLPAGRTGKFVPDRASRSTKAWREALLTFIRISVPCSAVWYV